MREITATKNESDQRLDKWLMKYLNKAPKSFVYKMLRKKNIKLNGKRASGNERIQTGDQIQIYLSEAAIEEFSVAQEVTVKSNLNLIYEDEHILVINKPVGMLSQKADKDDVSLVEHVIAHLVETGQITVADLQKFRPSVCNRLDRNTSGIVIAGKSLTGLQEMAELFKSRTLDKYYLCLVKGRLEKEQEIQGFLCKDNRTNKVTVRDKAGAEGQLIRTRYVPLARDEACTLLQVKLITGRSHQIRAHLAAIGHPIAGDYKYGSKLFNEAWKKKYKLKAQLLHSWILEVPEIDGSLSYLSGKQFQAELPAAFMKILKERKLYGNVEFKRS